MDNDVYYRVQTYEAHMKPDDDIDDGVYDDVPVDDGMNDDYVVRPLTIGDDLLQFDLY